MDVRREGVSHSVDAVFDVVDGMFDAVDGVFDCPEGPMVVLLVGHGRLSYAVGLACGIGSSSHAILVATPRKLRDATRPPKGDGV
jgi:hypothetical protein